MMKLAFLLSSVLYLLLYALKITGFHFFLSGYLSDVLCIPLMVGWTTVLMRSFYRSDFYPDAYLVLLTFAIVSIYFEAILPAYSDRAIGDAWDVLAYFAGTLIWLLFMSRKLKTEADLHPEF